MRRGQRNLRASFFGGVSGQEILLYNVTFTLFKWEGMPMKFLERSKEEKEIQQITAPEDEELRQLVEKLRVNIKIIGCGGGGSNTINRMMEEGVYGAELIAANTDAQHLLHIRANRKILLGRRRTRGLGAGSDPLIGEDAARETSEELERLLQNADMVFVTAGLGGGTGTGSAPYIAKIAKEQGALVLSVVTLPFRAEGKLRMENALWGLERLRRYSDTTIVIPNDKLLEIVPRLPLNEAFKVADTVLMITIKGITEILTKPGLVNVDYADLRTVLGSGGVAMVGIGESDSSQDRVKEAVEEAINSPLIDADISDSTGALVRIVGDEHMSVSEAQMAVDLVQKKINPMAKIIWGASVDPEMDNMVQVLVVLAGVKSPYFIEKGGSLKAARQIAGETLDAEIDVIE